MTNKSYLLGMLVLLSGCSTHSYTVDTHGMSWYEKGKYSYEKKSIIKINTKTGETWKYTCKPHNPCYWLLIENKTFTTETK